MTGLRSTERKRSPASQANREKIRQQPCQRRDVGPRPATRAEQERRASDATDHRLGFVDLERAAAEHHVLQHFDEDPAQAEQRHRAEQRIALDPHEALHPALQLARHQDAIETRLRRLSAARRRSSWKPARTASASLTPSSTPPISDLCWMSAEASFSTTGYPMPSAKATASSALPSTASAADSIPARASRRLASASPGVEAGNCSPPAGRRRRNGRAKASPNRPMAWIATTARVGSSNSAKPASS